MMKFRLNFFLALAFLFVFSRSLGFSEDLTWNTKVFPDGFTLVTKEAHSHPSCSVHLFVAVGSANESPEINGISHFYEHLFFKGTKRRNSEQMKSEIETYGGNLNGATYRDYTEFIVDIPSVYVDKAVDLLMDAFLNATLDPVELEKERKVVLDEVSLDAANPQRRLTDVFQKSIYSVHPYRLPVAGTAASVRQITRDDVVHWKQTHYLPSNAFLVIAGDVNTAKLEAQVAEFLSAAPNNTVYNRQILPKEPQKTQPLVRQMNEQVNQGLLDLGYLVTGLDTPDDIYPLDVLTFMLGYGRSSLLTRELKDDLHLVSEISADFLTQRYPSTLQIVAITKPDQVESCKKKVLEILSRVRKGEIENFEVERGKTLLEGVYTLGNVTNSGKVSTIGFYVSMGAGEFAKQYLARIRKVTLADITRVAQKYLQDNYVEAVFLPQRPPPVSKSQ